MLEKTLRVMTSVRALGIVGIATIALAAYGAFTLSTWIGVAYLALLCLFVVAIWMAKSAINVVDYESREAAQPSLFVSGESELPDEFPVTDGKFVRVAPGHYVFTPAGHAEHNINLTSGEVEHGPSDRPAGL